MLAVEVTEPVVSADPVALRGFPFERHIEPIGAAFLQARKQQHRQAATGGAAEEDEEDEEDDDAPEEEAGGGSADKEGEREKAKESAKAAKAKAAKGEGGGAAAMSVGFARLLARMLPALRTKFQWNEKQIRK